MATAAGIAIAGGVAQNGAVVDLWLASRFGGTPAYNAAPPAGSPDAGPATSSTTFGAPGAWQITGVADGSYYTRTTFSGNVFWGGPYAIEDDTDLVHRAGPETITGLKTFSGGLTVSGGVVTLPAGTVSMAGLTGTLPIANGGTGAATQNFVDLTTPQAIGGVKTFSAIPVFSTGITVSPGGTITIPNGSIPYAAVAGLALGSSGIDLGSSQIVTGQKTFDNDVPIVGGSLIGTAIATPSAPVVTPTGAAGATTYQYRIVAVTYDGRDSINSATGQTTTGNATLSGTNYNALSWSVVTGAASYKVLKFVAGSWQLLAGNIAATTYNDTGSASPSAYTLITVNPGGEISGTTGTFAGTVSANGALVGGVTSARFVGLVPIGGPSAGTWLAGDHGIDSKGRMVACTVGGTSGTWVTVGAGGEIGYVQTIVNQGSITAQVDLTSLTYTLTVPANRKLKITATIPLATNTVVGGGAVVYILEGSTQLGEGVAYCPGNNTGFTVQAIARVLPSAGSHTYKAQAQAILGGGTVSTNSNLQASFLLTEDIGAV